MVFNVIAVMKGALMRKPGSSDLAEWVVLATKEEFFKQQAVQYFDQYWWASLVNTWRFTRLEAAHIGMRNIVIALIVIVILITAISLLDPAKDRKRTRLNTSQ